MKTHLQKMQIHKILYNAIVTNVNLTLNVTSTLYKYHINTIIILLLYYYYYYINMIYILYKYSNKFWKTI